MTDRLWAPWRMDYIKDLDKGGCAFCAAAEGIPGKNREHRVLATRKNEFVILNKYPYAFGHIMVCPVRHVDSLDKLTREEQCSFFQLVTDSQSALSKAINPQGMNLGMNIGKDAGAGIDDHIHMHMVPRWKGDTNFMPLLAECRIMPAHLDQIFEELETTFSKI